MKSWHDSFPPPTTKGVHLTTEFAQNSLQTLKFAGKSTQNGPKHLHLGLSNRRMARRSLFTLCALAAVMAFGCVNESKKWQSEPTVTPGTEQDADNLVFLTNTPHETVARGFEMNSAAGCAIDSDCAAGMFCFHGQCTNECSASNPCAKGTCSRHGRCVASASSDAGARNLIDEEKESLEEGQSSDIVEQIPGATVLTEPDSKVFVEAGSTTTVVTLTTMEDYGTISYVVSKPLDDTVSPLMQSEPIIDGAGKAVVYQFEIPVKESSLDDRGSVERVILDTSVGTYEIALAPRKPATGLYDGSVSAEQFGGVGLPIRMILETAPKEISSFEDIEGLTVYLPSSGSDLFSPEIIEDASKTTWSKIVMKFENASNCMNGDKCWSAYYSTNDFTFPQSGLLDANQKVNRSIRIEIAGYDGTAMMFDGNIRDILAGVYREVDDAGNKQWGKASMEGSFIVTRKNSFDAAKYTIVGHESDTEKLRDLSADEADICTDADVKALMEQAGEDCNGIVTVAGFNAAENARECLLASSNHMLESPKMVSKIIEALITKTPEELGPDEGGGFTTLADFMTDCAKPDGICAERHDIVCAVDLLGRSYLTSNETNKVRILENWHQLMRESYLGRQYSAWQNDVEVRKKWLEGASTPSFLASTIESFNTKMLEEWENNVFAAHRNVLAKQFNQTSLEVLTRVDDNEDVISARDLILAEFSDGWAGVSDSMALGLRRYDTLYQGTKQRSSKAAEMRPHLFDLYYAGLIETAINRNTGNGSLNAAYGKNLYENVARLRSLDQSFDDLVFMRDAEVVTSTSLDPGSGNLQVLSERKALAKETLAQAEKRRKDVFDANDQKTIDKEKINATLTGTLDSLQTEIVSLCGLPRGCIDIGNPVPSCLPRTDPGFCGFDLPADSLIPGGIDKDIDVEALSLNQNEIDLYYSTKAYEITDDKLITLTESDILEMSDTNRNTLLGIAEEDLKDKSEDEIKKIISERIKAYLAYQTAMRNYSFTDYYSLTNSGQAADAIMAYRAALKDVDIAQADFIALNNKVAIARSTCDAYADNIDKWNISRLELLKKIQKNVEIINQHFDNITQAERDKLSLEISTLEEQYSIASEYKDKWSDLTTKYKDAQIDDVNRIKDLTYASTIFEYTVGLIDRTTESASAFWEEAQESDKYLGFSHFGVMKGIVTSAGNAAAAAFETVILGLDLAKIQSEAAMQRREYNYEYDIQLEELQADLKTQEAELNLQRSLAQFEPYSDEKACKQASEKDCHSIVTCDCSAATEELDDIYSEVSCPESKGCHLVTEWYVQGLDQWILSEQNAIDTLDEVNDTMRELFEVQDAYERDLQDLAFRRDEYLKLAQDLGVKREQIAKAQIQAYSALKHYYTIVQRAISLQSQYDAAHERLDKLNNLYSTPASLFAFASDLETVESKIELAKERIYDYVSAVEYFAVRPFVDLRRATYLARSTNDLDAIIDQLDTVVSKCGGITNLIGVEISAREMMGITSDFANMTMGERFRSVIAKGNIPVNSLTRYTVDTSVRDLVKRSGDLRSGTFAVTIDQQMNLATTCNAKIDSIAVKIVGEDLIKEGAGSNVHPTITIFYDGQSQLVSCQPKIDSLVSLIGEKTSYGKYSTFIVEPTKISPVAGINAYGDPNGSFAGKPFATSYTVLIDTKISENGKIDWDKVEDIMLQVKYTYQDFFPNSSACVNL